MDHRSTQRAEDPGLRRRERAEPGWAPGGGEEVSREEEGRAAGRRMGWAPGGGGEVSREEEGSGAGRTGVGSDGRTDTNGYERSLYPENYIWSTAPEYTAS